MSGGFKDQGLVYAVRIKETLNKQIKEIQKGIKRVSKRNTASQHRQTEQNEQKDTDLYTQVR